MLEEYSVSAVALLGASMFISQGYKGDMRKQDWYIYCQRVLRCCAEFDGNWDHRANKTFISISHTLVQCSVFCLHWPTVPCPMMHCAAGKRGCQQLAYDRSNVMSSRNTVAWLHHNIDDRWALSARLHLSTISPSNPCENDSSPSYSSSTLVSRRW